MNSSQAKNNPSGSRTVRTLIPFRLKLTIIGSILALIPLAIVGIQLQQLAEDTIATLSRELQISSAQDLRKTVESDMHDAFDLLDHVGKILTNPEIPEEQTEALVAATVASDALVDHVAVYDVGGGLIDVVREKGMAEISVNKTLSEDTRKRAIEENAVAGNFHHFKSGPRFEVLLPMKSGDQVVGFLQSYVSVATLQARIETLAKQHYQDIDDALMVVTSNGDIVAHPNESVVREKRSAKDVLSFKTDLSRHTEFSGSALGTNGQELVSTQISIESLSWIAVAQVPKKIAYAALYQMRSVVWGTLAVTAILALLLAFVVAKQITRPIRQLSDFANDLAKRKFDRRVNLKTRDEFGMLGAIMSQAAQNLEQSEAKIREEQAIRNDLGRYLSSDLVDAVVRREQDMELGGSRRQVTVLFADVVSFTPMSEQLAAEQVVALLNELFTILTEIVFRHDGTIDKFIGDCVMAIWGAPTPLDDHAERAVAAAEDMMNWLEAGNDSWEEKYGIRIELAIGINTGEAVVGNIGSESRMEYTAIGDSVNIAARLESIARPGQILVTKATKESAGPHFEYRDIGPREMSGRAEPVDVSEVVI